MSYVRDLTSGGTKISNSEAKRIQDEIELYACSQAWGKEVKLAFKFKQKFCYISTIDDSDGKDMPLCRLRHFNPDLYGLSLFLYSNDKYEPVPFPSGEWGGSLMEAFKIAEEFVV